MPASQPPAAFGFDILGGELDELPRSACSTPTCTLVRKSSTLARRTASRTFNSDSASSATSLSETYRPDFTV